MPWNYCFTERHLLSLLCQGWHLFMVLYNESWSSQIKKFYGTKWQNLLIVYNQHSTTYTLCLDRHTLVDALIEKIGVWKTHTKRSSRKSVGRSFRYVSLGLKTAARVSKWGRCKVCGEWYHFPIKKKP